MTYKNSLISLILIMMSGFAAWLTLSFSPQNTITIPLAKLPDAIMEGVTATIMNKQGKVSMKIVTPKLTHYAENDTTYLTEPAVTIYYNSPQPWYVNSQYGKAMQGIDRVNFWDNVVVHHSADQSNPATVIKTATLTVYPHQQEAETTDLITLFQPNTIIKAIGMHANMNSGDIKLLSEARGEYVPTS